MPLFLKKACGMTMTEVNTRGCIPVDVLEKYEDWNMGEGNYTGHDIKCLSLILTLQKVGFQNAQTLQYMQDDGRGGRLPNVW